MQLTEIHQILKTNSNWKQLDQLCFLSKNLYNATLYKIRHRFEKNGKWLRYLDLEKEFRSENNSDYFTIPSASSQQILRLMDKNLKSFFSALKVFKRDKTKFKGCPKFPNYKHKTQGRNIFIIRGDTIRYKDGKIFFPKRLGLNPIRTKINPDQKINEVRIVPNRNCYKIEVIYTVQEKEIVQSNKVLGIDLGLNNLFTCVTNTMEHPFIINGRPLKSINQYYNKRKGEIQSKLETKNKKKISKRLQRLINKRNNKIKDYLHKSTRIVVNYCKYNNIGKVVIGHNKGWKQEIELGKRNNQNFVQIPFDIGIKQLHYKLKLEGIECKVREESYTSKCSALDLEEVKKHEVYKGKRIKRGLFKTSTGILINADVNGALNILRKETCDVEIPTGRGFTESGNTFLRVLNPLKIKIIN